MRQPAAFRMSHALLQQEPEWFARHRWRVIEPLASERIATPHGANDQVLLAICSNKAPNVGSAAFARSPPARAFRPAIIIENIMQPGHGRLILRDGTDLPVGYCLLQSQGAGGCRGILIGNIRSLDQNALLKPIQIALDNEPAFAALVISHSERHVRFATNLGQLSSRAQARIRLDSRPVAVSR